MWQACYSYLDVYVQMCTALEDKVHFKRGRGGPGAYCWVFVVGGATRRLSVSVPFLCQYFYRR